MSKLVGKVIVERQELILMALADGPLTVRELANQIGTTPALVYHQLYLLEAAGSVGRTSEFPARCFLVENVDRNESASNALSDPAG